MTKENRYDAILNLLDDEEYMSVQQLSERLYVSLPTIRRDLTELARQGMVIRSHGGVKRPEDGRSSIPLAFRSSFKSREKQQLSRAAASLIPDGSVIFLDASTTISYIADYIQPQQGVTVITNSIYTAARLLDNNIHTYCTGGEMIGSSHCFAGSLAERFVENFNFDIAFFSSYGINERGYIVDTSGAETAFRQKLFQYCSKKVYVCDGEKFYLSAPFNVVPLQEVDHIVTNVIVPEEFGIDKRRILFTGK